MGVLTTTINFADGDQVTSSKLNEIIGGSSFTASAVYDDSLQVNNGKLQVGTVRTSNLGDDSVTQGKIADDAVGADQLAANAVVTASIADANVTTAKIADKAVTIAKVADAAFAPRASVETPAGALITSPDVLKYHPGIAKAYGIVALAPSDASISGSYNVTSASAASATSRAVVLGITMANTDYVVIATYVEGASIGASIAVENKTTTGFTLYTAPQATGRKVQFSVFGKLAP